MVWLSLNQEALPPSGVVSYRCKKTILSASARLGHNIQGASGTCEIELSAQARFLMQNWRFEASVSIPPQNSEGTVGFARAWEHSGKIERRFSAANDEVIVVHAGREGKDRVPIPPSAPAPVLNPLQIPAALAGSWKEEASAYAAWIILGTKLYGFEASPVDKSRLKTKGVVAFTAAAVALDSAAEDLSEATWHGLPWHSGKSFVFEWNVHDRRLESALYRAPVVGDVELEFDGFSPA